MKGLLKSHSCGELGNQHVSEEVTLCGWVNKYRDLGGLHFIDLRDKYGLTQLSFDDFEGDLSILKKCSLESVLKVVGVVRSRPDVAINKKMKTGEVEVAVKSLEILSRCDIDNIPFLPYGQVEATEDNRLKYRYLDLRTKRLQGILALRSKVTTQVRMLMSGQDFVEIETPILYKSTPEGARDYVVPSRVHPGKVYALPQSPQTLKQLLMIGGTDKYFQLSRCFRDEDLRADRQPEFTQIDIEASFATQEYIKNLVTYITGNVFDMGENFAIKTMTFNDAMINYGCDKPDTRFELIQGTVTDTFIDSSFSVFSTVAKAGGLIKSLFVPSSIATFSRKDTDGLVAVVKPYGGKGVAFYKVAADGTRSAGISKFITDEIHTNLEKETPDSKGEGTWFFFADERESVSHASADAVRRHFGEKYKLHNEGYHFLWVYDFPLVAWDDGAKRYSAVHHPFTSPKPEDLDAFLKADPTDANGSLKNMLSDSYDIVCNGYEIGGGSIRIHRQDVQQKMFEVLSMSEAEIKGQFGFFIEALRYGTPPHGGIAFGLDRVIMLLAGTDSIRDVIAFPKTTSASDLMSDAPSAPSDGQTEELHFKWRE